MQKTLTGLLAVASVAALLGCNGGGGGGRSATLLAPSTAPTTSSTPRTSPAPTTSSTTPTPPPPPPSPPTPPPPAPGASGGTSTQKGVFTRQVTTVAQAGLPPITVDYKVLVPQSYVFDAQKPVPLVISELTPLSSWDQIPEQEGFILVEQQGYLGAGRGFTYSYDPLVLARILDDVEATWNVDTKRVYLTGFSAGAHWSYTIGLANATVFAGLGICAGSLGSAASVGVWVPGSTTQPNVPRKVFVAIRHGTADTVVPVNEGRLARDQLTAAGHAVDYMELNLGHTVTTAELSGLWAALKPQRLP